MDWLNAVIEILSSPVVVALLTLVVSLSLSYFLAMRRERKLRIVERHSDDLRILGKRWIKEVPLVPSMDVPLISKPATLEVPVENEYLFGDLKNHMPTDVKLLETWQKFKRDLLDFDNQRFSFFQDILKDVKERTGLPYNPDFRKGRGFTDYFVKAIYKDAFRMVEDRESFYINQQTRIEKNKDVHALWTPSGGLAQGTEEEILKAEKVRRQMLSKSSLSKYAEQVKQIMKKSEELHKSRQMVLRRINDFNSIPIFPGKCKYIKWAIS